MQRKFEERESDLVDALNVRADDPGFEEFSKLARVDLGDAIGSADMAEAIVSGPHAGTRKLIGKMED